MRNLVILHVERELVFINNLDFRRVLLSFGVETDPVTSARVWDRFRFLANIDKDDDVLDDTLEKTLSMAEECIELASKQAVPVGDEAAAAIRVERGNETISLDVAKRVFRRMETMKKLREEIINSPNVNQN